MFSFVLHLIMSGTPGIKSKWTVSMIEELMTAKEIRQALKIGKDSLHSLIKSGKLPATKIGNKYLFKVQDVRKLLAADQAVN